MESATRSKVGKIESRMVLIPDEDLIFLARALNVGTDELYPDFIRGAKRLYEAICQSKASRFGAFLVGSLSCTQLGATLLGFTATIANV